MTTKITRRDFLAMTAGAATLGLNGCLAGTSDPCIMGADGKESARFRNRTTRRSTPSSC